MLSLHEGPPPWDRIRNLSRNAWRLDGSPWSNPPSHTAQPRMAGTSLRFRITRFRLWLREQVVETKGFERTILCLILLNCAVLATEHPGMNETLRQVYLTPSRLDPGGSFGIEVLFFPEDRLGQELPADHGGYSRSSVVCGIPSQSPRHGLDSQPAALSDTRRRS